MRFYEVNQRKTFKREFWSGYLCCPEGPYGGWPYMMDLQDGDIIFHYSSRRQAVLGISRLAPIGQHKGAAADAAQRPGTQCISFEGPHLSKDDFTLEETSHHQNYRGCLEVHTIPCMERKLPKLLRSVPQAYLVLIPDREALSYLNENQISLDQLQPIKA